LAVARRRRQGYLNSCRYVLHDRDKKFCASFRSALASGGVRTIPLAAQSPNLNAFAERWVRSVKQECLSKLILIGEGPLLRVLTDYTRHYHSERNHQGKGNRILFPDLREKRSPQHMRSNVASDSAVYSSITGAPHEYFYQTGTFCLIGESLGPGAWRVFPNFGQWLTGSDSRISRRSLGLRGGFPFGNPPGAIDGRSGAMPSERMTGGESRPI
jgi:hypothetical protein